MSLWRYISRQKGAQRRWKPGAFKRGTPAKAKGGGWRGKLRRKREPPKYTGPYKEFVKWSDRRKEREQEEEEAQAAS